MKKLLVAFLLVVVLGCNLFNVEVSDDGVSTERDIMIYEAGQNGED